MMNIGAFISRDRASLLGRYAIAGAFGAFVQTGTLYVWVSMWGLKSTYLLGAFLGFCLALAVTFILQKYWTFRDHTTHRTHAQLMSYSIVAVINVMLNISILALAKELFYLMGIDFFNGWYIVVQIAIVGFASAVSFILNYFFTFRKRVSPIIEESLEPKVPV